MIKYLTKIPAFYEETKQEVKKCTWPSRPELAESTMVVIITVALITVFTGLVDILSQKIVEFIITL